MRLRWLVLTPADIQGEKEGAPSCSGVETPTGDPALNQGDRIQRADFCTRDTNPPVRLCRKPFGFVEMGIAAVIIEIEDQGALFGCGNANRRSADQPGRSNVFKRASDRPSLTYLPDRCSGSLHGTSGWRLMLLSVEDETWGGRSASKTRPAGCQSTFERGGFRPTDSYLPVRCCASINDSLGWVFLQSIWSPVGPEAKEWKQQPAVGQSTFECLLKRREISI